MGRHGEKEGGLDINKAGLELQMNGQTNRISLLSTNCCMIMKFISSPLH